MKIYLYLTEEILSYSLPQEISGSFSFDPNQDEEKKLINIEARDNKWVIYSTEAVNVMQNNTIISTLQLESNNFYILRREEKNYLIYASDLTSDTLQTYSYDNKIDLVIGNNNSANIQYPCPFLNKMLIKIHYVDNNLTLENLNKTTGIYINNIALTNLTHIINIGEQINIYGLKIMFLQNLIIMNNPGGKLIITDITPNITKYKLPKLEEKTNIEIKDKNLYEKEDYFSKAPRIRRIIETKTIKLSPPPRNSSNDELPMILTVGPMLTMGITSGVTMLSVLTNITSGKSTLSDQWPSLVTSSAMMVSMLLWPLLIRAYNKKMKKKKQEELIKKYGEYLNTKKEELLEEQKLQKDILLENLISIEECLKIIKNKTISLWDKRIDQSDFLIVRIGYGNELLDAKIEYPEEGFTVEEDNLKKQADKMVEDFKYINDVPISYSFYDNKVTAIMGNNIKSFNFLNNIILQLITFYSYEDLKIVVFTQEKYKERWDYIKYLNHNFSNNKNIRFFASDQESAKNVAEYLNFEVSNRVNYADKAKQGDLKPHYLVIIDDYDKVKRFDFIKTITEEDNNLGFSIVIVEERLSKLPSKCNNFISLGINESGVLKNSYEKQEQIKFKDEINYNINMMNVAKILSNIPIEFEEGLSSLPDSISFMEMEKVGKVEQLNILNRWNINDSTQSLKAEVGVDESGDLMYLDLHEKYHGPHGLIAGTTGSGKSEFIITYILSMAINYSPDDVAFILIDYKGGGLALAFENKTTGISLPHLAGTITNLDKAEMDRTLVSIDSEVKRRQQMFNIARDNLGESTIDIYKYQRYYHEGKLKEPIPHLFIICDEFAELKSQQPEFMDNLISVARIGRSLGVHLILATQKPSGVVNDQIWSNTKFRVCLKVQDEADSKEMLKRPEAAQLKQAGRYYLQVGYDEYFALGQSGWCGAKYYPSDTIVKQVDKSVNFINDNGAFIKSIQASSGIKIEAQGEQLAAIMNSIIEISKKANKKAQKLWLDNIPPIILVDNLEQKYNVQKQPYDVTAVIGEYDAPEKQEQGLVIYKYITNGNTIIYGNDGQEREMLLNTIIYSTLKNYTSEEINYYAIDYGSEFLRRYQTFPHFGGIVYANEEEKYNNLLKMIKEELSQRKKLFSDYGGEYINYIKNTKQKLPIKVIIMNNYDSIYESNPEMYDELPELVRDSERYGIIYILTCNAINSIQNKISSNFPNTYTFKLKDSSDYGTVFGLRTKTVPRETVGRGLFKDETVHEFQTASITEDEDKLNDYLKELSNKLKENNQIRAKRIPTLPNIVTLDDVKEEITNLNNIPIGISKKELQIEKYDYLTNLGNIISSNKIANTEVFTKSLISIFNLIPNNVLMIIDPLKILLLDNQQYPNYYNDNIEQVLEKITNYLDELIKNKSNQKGIILIYGINKLISKLENTSKLEELTKKIKQYEKISLIIIDDHNKIKNYSFESWFTSIFSTNDGIWIGRGIPDQNLFRLSTVTKEMTKDIKNNMGYLIQENTGTLVKLIDFISKEDDQNGE